MRNLFVYLFICSFIFVEDVCAQAVVRNATAGPYTFRSISSFETPKGFIIRKPIVYSDGILQPSFMGSTACHFQWFSNDLEMLKENTIDISSRLGSNIGVEQFLQLKTKSYLLGAEYFSERASWGEVAIEIDLKRLDLKGNLKHLYEPSGKVSSMNIGNTNLGYGIINISEDKTKFMSSYILAPKGKGDNLNRNVIGMFVYDENLTKIWGDEIEMPYVEAEMQIFGCAVTNDGEVCLLVKVYQGEGHFEALVYQKGSKAPKVIEIKLDNYFSRGIHMYQDKLGNIAIAGFYAKKTDNGVDGSYLLTLDIDKGRVSEINGGFFEIPLIKSLISDREALLISDIYSADDGSIKIVSEIFWTEGHSAVATTSNGMTTSSMIYHYDDIIILNIKGGKVEWIKKVPKNTTNKEFGTLFINSILIDNDVHVFWKDNPENSNIVEGKMPSKFTGRNGMLRGCKISANGEMEKYDIVNLKDYKIRCNLKEFRKSGKNNTLSNAERSKKINSMYVIDVK